MNALAILYEDNDMFVLDKPAGITVNKSETTSENTVQSWTEQKIGIERKKLSKGEQEPDYTSEEYASYSFRNRGGIVHRLDKETSGILLVAKNVETFKNLQEQFKARLVRKTYFALVHGVINPPAGEIRIPVDRLPWNKKRFGIVPGGKSSETIYKTLNVYATKGKLEKLSLVELTPKTGRTHQIRVHMKYLNHPIVSDFLYAGRKTSRDDRKLLGRVFLHAAKVALQHPSTRKEISFESPLPEELKNFIANYLVDVL